MQMLIGFRYLLFIFEELIYGLCPSRQQVVRLQVNIIHGVKVLLAIKNT